MEMSQISFGLIFWIKKPYVRFSYSDHYRSQRRAWLLQHKIRPKFSFLLNRARGIWPFQRLPCISTAAQVYDRYLVSHIPNVFRPAAQPIDLMSL